MDEYLFRALVDKGGYYFRQVGQSRFLNLGGYCLEYFHQYGVLLLHLDDLVLVHLVLVEDSLDELL